MKQGQQYSEAGYSLIEIMVALFIVGLTTTFVVLSLPRGTDPVEKAVDRFHRQLSVARQVSQTSGEAIGVRIEARQSSVLVFRRGAWEPADQFGDVQTLVLDEPVTFNLPQQNRRAQTGRSVDDEPVSLVPQIWFDSSGIATGEDILISGQTGSRRFTLARNGDIAIE